uniref:Phosphoribosylamine--glycine ligase n=1 Tax=Lygus hesperus TaxID=30085 RepID=A0A0A9X0B9_LYGHE
MDTADDGTSLQEDTTEILSLNVLDDEISSSQEERDAHVSVSDIPNRRCMKQYDLQLSFHNRDDGSDDDRNGGRMDDDDSDGDSSSNSYGNRFATHHTQNTLKRSESYNVVLREDATTHRLDRRKGQGVHPRYNRKDSKGFQTGGHSRRRQSNASYDGTDRKRRAAWDGVLNGGCTSNDDTTITTGGDGTKVTSSINGYKSPQVYEASSYV